MASACASVSPFSWNDFANNLGSDLAPLLTLFGEQVTKQYLSKSCTLTDSFIFALAPMGIITAIVAAIRVGGSQNFRSLIGRATESRATVEADLMSSTSADVCELWSGEGVVRVLESPALLQLIYVAEDKSETSAGIYTLPEAIRRGYYSKGTGPDHATEIIQDFDLENYYNYAFNDLAGFQALQSPPNLSLNVSIKLKNRDSVSKVVAPVGVILQGGVLIFAAVAQ